MQVAKIILDQLGGARFVAMTGAKNLAASADTLSFRLPANFARDRINAVRVKLEASDTYTVTFLRVGRRAGRGIVAVELVVEELVYADALRATFTRVTGLDCTL